MVVISALFMYSLCCPKLTHPPFSELMIVVLVLIKVTIKSQRVLSGTIRGAVLVGPALSVQYLVVHGASCLKAVLNTFTPLENAHPYPRATVQVSHETEAL